MSRRMTIALAVGALGLTGCARTLDNNQAAHHIEHTLRARGVPVVRVGCPEVEAKPNHRVVCDVLRPHRRLAHGVLTVLDRAGHFRFDLARR